MVLGVVMNVIEKMALESFDTLNVNLYVYIYIVTSHFPFIISYSKFHYNVTYFTEEKHKVDE